MLRCRRLYNAAPGASKGAAQIISAIPLYPLTTDRESENQRAAARPALERFRPDARAPPGKPGPASPHRADLRSAHERSLRIPVFRSRLDPARRRTVALGAERFLSGEMPHRDYDEAYSGGLTLLHAIAFRIFGTNLVSLRLVLFLFFRGCSWPVSAREAAV